MRIVIADCDHDSLEPERAVAAAAGVSLIVAQCKTEAEVIEAARNADGLLVQYAPVTADVLDAAPTLRAVGRYGVGVDTVDVDAASARGIAVCNVPDYGVEEVSDHALALTLTLARGITALDRGSRAGEPDLNLVKPLHRIQGCAFGVVGLGAIGRETARKALALGYRVLGYDPYIDVERLRETGVEAVALDELLTRCDVVSLHVPLTADTRHLINTERLAAMRSSALLINTSRGGVIDTDALVGALRSGGISGAGLDVVEGEPISAGHPLFSFPQVVITPHAAWYSEESEHELKTRAIGNVIGVCAARSLANVINSKALSARLRCGVQL